MLAKELSFLVPLSYMIDPAEELLAVTNVEFFSRAIVYPLALHWASSKSAS